MGNRILKKSFEHFYQKHYQKLFQKHNIVRGQN